MIVLYFDDIIVVERNFEEYLNNFNLVINCLREVNFKFKVKKCNFFCKKVLFFGYIVLLK